jgi:hypothetical protein
MRLFSKAKKTKSTKKQSRIKRRRKRKRKDFIKNLLSKLPFLAFKNRSKAKKRRRSQILKKLRNVSLLILSVSALSAGVYFVGRSVVQLKLGGSQSGNTDYTLEGAGQDVIGVEGVPQYPESEFLFANHIEEKEVQEFLDEKQSAYSIPLESTWTDVVEFYKKELKNRGWEHVNSIDYSDELRMYGEYWIKVDGASVNSEEISDGSDNTGEEDENNQSDNPDQNVSGRGLRVYTRLNDIWYQEISINQAQTGLAVTVAERNELDFLISMSSGENLPQEVPWQLRFAPVWDFELVDSDYDGFKTIEFENPETDGKLVIRPIAYQAGQSYESLAAGFIEEVNEYRDEEDRFELKASQRLKVAGQDALRYNISSEEGLGSLCVTSNPEDGMIYVIATYKGQTGFFDYVIENIEVRQEEEEE